MTVYERDFYNNIDRLTKHITRRGEPDWEQRRYEIAKECMATGLISQYTPYDADVNLLAKDAVLLADALIEELKKSKP